MEQPSPEPIPYAIPRDHTQTASSPWPLIALVIVALGLIVIGGCFSIGLLLLNMPQLVAINPPNRPMTDAQTFLAFLLTALTLICFTFGIWLTVSVVRKLLRRI